ncbi:MAG TPA: NADH-quinone oxidoreductase subunit J [Terracidiphilus sp.]|nr:NADH-quinone oxidoreductase subunit J [Terracidiphilus sp.]
MTMEVAFFVSGSVAVIATILAITRLVAVHALLYLIVSLLAVAVVFYTMGAPLVAALEVIIYAGAIVVLFLFVVMMMNLGVRTQEIESKWLAGRAWIGPGILSALLLVEVIYLIVRAPVYATMSSISTPKQIGLALYGPYLLGVELASMLLLAALVGVCHLGRKRSEARQ